MATDDLAIMNDLPPLIGDDGSDATVTEKLSKAAAGDSAEFTVVESKQKRRAQKRRAQTPRDVEMLQADTSVQAAEIVRKKKRTQVRVMILLLASLAFILRPHSTFAPSPCRPIAAVH